jgi:hypothetical protein
VLGFGFLGEKREELVDFDVLRSVHQWGLHNGASGRLSALAQLATLQHFGAPTRMIDVTLNAYIGLWFAVQPLLLDGMPGTARSCSAASRESASVLRGRPVRNPRKPTGA